MAEHNYRACEEFDGEPHTAADHRVRKPYVYDNPIGPGTKCTRCAGTGKFVTYMENGVPKGPGGPCFRCGGKGYQTEADARRNYGYDVYGRRVY